MSTEETIKHHTHACQTNKAMLKYSDLRHDATVTGIEKFYTPKVFDSFLYFGDVSLLRLRYELLKDVVDVFVLIEATHTLSGQAKPYYFESQKQRLPEDLVRRAVIGYTTLPYLGLDGTNMSLSQGNERYQRSTLAQMLRDHVSLDARDIVLHSEVNELFSASAIRTVLATLSLPSKAAEAVLRVGMVQLESNWSCVSTSEEWRVPVALTYGTMIRLYGSEGAWDESMRSLREGSAYEDSDVIVEGGWRLSGFNRADKAYQALESYLATEVSARGVVDSAALRTLCQRLQDDDDQRDERTVCRSTLADTDELEEVKRVWGRVEGQDLCSQQIAGDSRGQPLRRPDRDDQERDYIQRSGQYMQQMPTALANYLRFLKSTGFYPEVVYDIGAALGQWTALARDVWPNATFVLFEAIEHLEFLFEGHLHHMGVLSDSEKVVKFYQNDVLMTGSSYYKEIGLGAYSDAIFPRDKYILKRTSTLDQVVRERGFPLPDLIKMDVQGCEIDILKGTSNRVLQHATHLLIELQKEQYNEGASLADESVVYIESRGFRCIAPDVSPAKVDGDYGFIRTSALGEFRAAVGELVNEQNEASYSFLTL